MSRKASKISWNLNVSSLSNCIKLRPLGGKCSQPYLISLRVLNLKSTNYITELPTKHQQSLMEKINGKTINDTNDIFYPATLSPFYLVKHFFLPSSSSALVHLVFSNPFSLTFLAFSNFSDILTVDIIRSSENTFLT